MENSTFEFRTVYPSDSSPEMEEVRNLLSDNQLELETRVEVFVVCEAEGRIIACAGLDHNTIKCVAVADEWRGVSLSLQLGTEVIKLAAQRGQFHLFLYSRPHNLPFFRGWGFYPLVQVPQLVVLMDNSPTALRQYCAKLRSQHQQGKTIGGVVLNANPFTRGHQYLVEKAAGECEWLHVFVVKEEASLFSYADRFALVQEGVAPIGNLTLHPGSDYIISRATFPGYFLKEQATIDHGWAGIDLLLFREYIAPALGITHRFVGAEPFDPVTNQYNRDMKTWLEQSSSPAPPIAVVEVPRVTASGAPISATEVRRLLAQGDYSRIEQLVPATTMQFLETKYPLGMSISK
ncbi:MAG TPA: [citrate (pro-3S)-lyase] ligase [Phycisphaerae bacterium]|nr:[citrate (pro-3S)-lyase] ligase [Phycisphaerae bacterium]